MRIVLKLFFLIGLATAQVDVVPLIEEWQLDEMVKAFTLVTWSTLVRDGDHTIIVDLPQANETDVAMKLTHALKGKNLTPDGIQKLVFTHDRPKNNEHKSIFPNAHQFFSTYEYNRETFVRTGLYENGKIQLTPNVELWYTPGHSSEDITVMVNNVENRGRVAITGNLIYDLHDIVDSKLWESRAQHLHAGLKRRRKVICHANYIIPGHGAIFQVTEKHRNAVKCKDEHGQEGT
uniref:Metallo-beta-lactamase domain-containing protein n=1 Tax=Plectus sambesii TaxID=2011161 RepID=A0A914WZE2_9BILA